MPEPSPAILVRNLPVFPYERPWVGGPEIARIPPHGRIRSADPRRKHPDGFPSERLGQPREKLSGSYLYGGPLYHHFGHVMIDSIIRLWAYDPTIHTDGVIFPLVLSQLRPTHPDFFFEICRSFGIERDRIRIIDRPTTVEAVHFAEPGSASGAGPAPWYLEKLKRVETFFLDRAPADLRTHDRLFIGRRHLGKGSLMGEGYFASRLAKLGFHDFKPEQYPLAAQIRFLKAAREIVFLEGSAIHLTEVMTTLRAERVAIILRRSGTEALFKPHLDPRLRRPTDVIGSGSGLFRVNHNPEAKAGPGSLSYMLDPSAAYADMVRLGYAEAGGFDMRDFLRAERIEQAECVGADPRRLASHVAQLEQRRMQGGIALPDPDRSRSVLARLRSMLRAPGPTKQA